MIFEKDILHFRRFSKYVAAFWRMASSSVCSVGWDILNGLLLFPFRVGEGLLQFFTPGIKLRFVQAEFTGSGGYANI